MRNLAIKKHFLYASASLGFMLLTSTTFSANWLELQGTEAPGAEQLAKVWGFVQVQYQDDSSEASPAGTFVPPKLIGPNLESQSAFNVNRARIGVRGVAMPLDQNINYFVLLEMGNNGITEPENAVSKATDASITFNHIDGARFRAGLFKYPGSEEGLQAIHVFDYINFTWVSNQMLLERFANSNYTPNNAPQLSPPEKPLNAFDSGVGAFRDVGVQMFDWFKVGDDWEVAYAVMIGNGNGLNFTDNDDNKESYFYVSAEKVFGGKGARREGLKLFAWSQNGKRTVDLTNDGTFNPMEYDRDRSGFGVKYLNNGIRATAEYMTGDGMIFQGPHNASFGIGPGQGNPNAPGNGAYAEATGFYMEGGYRIPDTKWELDLRYDQYNRLEGDKFEIEYTRTTLGAQYFFNPRVRIAFNYELRDGDAINFPALGAGPTAGPNNNLGGIDNRIAVQVTAIWSQ